MSAPTGAAPADTAADLLAEIQVDRDGFRLTMRLAAPTGVTALLGPNGSGKTTALMAIAGLQPLDAGQIRVGDRIWAGGAGRPLAPEERSVGLVLAESMLFPHLSLVDNVAFGPRSRGMSRRAARDRAHLELERVGLADLAGRRPGEVSSGQAQRAALARALATDPQVLLLDEPLSALDPQTRSRTRADLAARLRDYPGVTVVTTHDPLDALTLADRLVFLEDGLTTQTGTPAEVVARPRTAYVASLVGLNLLMGTLVRDSHGHREVPGTDVQKRCVTSVARTTDVTHRLGTSMGDGWAVALTGTGQAGDGEASVREGRGVREGRCVREGGDGGLLVLAEPPEGTHVGQQVWATVNPEAVSLFTERPQTSARNVWALRVESVTVTGQRARVHLDGQVALVADVTLGAVAALGIARGQQLWASVKATEIHAYPA